MIQQLQENFEKAVQNLTEAGVIPAGIDVEVRFDRTKQKTHGDLATNLALGLAKAAKRNPRELAQLIVDALAPLEQVEKFEIAGPGFINVFLNPASQFEVLKLIRKQGQTYGSCDIGQ